jgi:hypothetical protein
MLYFSNKYNLNELNIKMDGLCIQKGGHKINF